MIDMDPSTPPASADYAAIAMQGSDRLRFFEFPEEIPRQAEGVVRRAWPEGIQSQQYLSGGGQGGAYEYQLVGNPFGSTGDKGGVASRILVRDLLAFLYERGWLLNTALAQSRSLQGKDTLIFRKKPASSSSSSAAAARANDDTATEKTVLTAETAVSSSTMLLPPVDWLVLGISKGDNLRLIGDDSRLVQTLRRELERIDSFVSGEWNADMGADGGFEFKLKNRPWRASTGEAPVKARLLILRILAVLDGFGWRSYGAICQRSGNDSYQKADTWYFVRSKDFVPGSPFNSEPLSLIPDLDS